MLPITYTPYQTIFGIESIMLGLMTMGANATKIKRDKISTAISALFFIIIKLKVNKSAITIAQIYPYVNFFVHKLFLQ